MISIIAARSADNAIGRNGTIPWKIEGEQEQFRSLTTGHTVIMGRRTYEDIGRPLPDRKTIVVSGSRTFEGMDLRTARSLSEAIDMAGEDEVYIAGGYALYLEALPLADRIYLTEVDLTVGDADTFFPEFDPADFDRTEEETVTGHPSYTRTLYVRKDRP